MGVHVARVGCSPAKSCSLIRLFSGPASVLTAAPGPVISFWQQHRVCPVVAWQGVVVFCFGWLLPDILVWVYAPGASKLSHRFSVRVGRCGHAL